MGVSISHLPSIFSILAFLLPYFPPGFLSSFLHYFLPFLPLCRLPFFLPLSFLPSFLPLSFCLTFPLSFPLLLPYFPSLFTFTFALLLLPYFPSLLSFHSALPSNPSAHHIVHYRLSTLCTSVFYRCWYGLCLCRY